jgi:Protein of unknown function (DUF1493)
MRAHARVGGHEMPQSVPIADEIKHSVAATFPPESHSRILAALSHPELGDQSREAVLILANGDESRLMELVEHAKSDFRDVVVLIDRGSRYSGSLSEQEVIQRCHDLELPLPSRWSTPERQKARMTARVKKFVADKLLIPVERLSSETCLQVDLELAGNDGIEFVRGFAEEFAVDLRGFVADRYFKRRRGERPVLDLLESFFGSKGVEVTPITIQSLVASAETKRWMDSTCLGSAGNGISGSWR